MANKRFRAQRKWARERARQLWMQRFEAKNPEFCALVRALIESDMVVTMNRDIAGNGWKWGRY